MKDNKKILLAIGIVLAGCAGSGPLASVGPLVDLLQSSFGISSAVTGLLTTIPLLIYASLSIVISALGRKAGMNRSMMAGLIFLLAGVLIRSYAGLPGLFGGTVFIGIGICVSKVLIPAIIKKEYPEKTGLLVGVYISASTVLTGVGFGVTRPLVADAGLDWRGAMAVWGILILAAIVAWIPQIWGRRGNVVPSLHVVERVDQEAKRPILKSRIAWWVMLFMGLQSLIFYCFLQWLPSILQSKGADAIASGYYSSLYQIIGMPAAFFVPVIAGKMKNQRALALGIGATYFIGMVLFLLFDAPWAIIVSLTLNGLCGNACLSIATSFIAMRARTGEQAARLSGVAQSLGYLLAAFGPTVMGKIYDISHSWDVSLAALIVVILALTLAGFKAGANKYLFEDVKK